MGQSPGDSVIAPSRVVPRHLYNQRLHFGSNPRTTRVRAILRAIELLRHEFAEPVEDSLGFGDQGYFLQSLPSQSPANLRQRGSLLIREAQSNWRMCPENPILRDKIFDLKQQLLIDQPRHVRQQTGHLVTFHPVCIFSGP